MVKRFEVYLCTFRGEIRPCVIISPDEMNETLPYVIIAPITSSEHAFPSRIGVRLKGKQGQIALDMIQTISQDSLLEKLGMIPHEIGFDVLQLTRKMFEI